MSVDVIGGTKLIMTYWAPTQYKGRFPGMGIPMLKIRRSRHRLIFDMGIPILVRRHLYIETVPLSQTDLKNWRSEIMPRRPCKVLLLYNQSNVDQTWISQPKPFWYRYVYQLIRDKMLIAYATVPHLPSRWKCLYGNPMLLIRLGLLSAARDRLLGQNVSSNAHTLHELIGLLSRNCYFSPAGI